MKKTILSFATLLLLAVGANAQTHSDLAGNEPTTDFDGYEYQFNGSATNNCMPTSLPGTNANWGQIFGTGAGTTGFNAGFQVNFATDALTIESDGSGNIFSTRLSQGDCAVMYAGNATDRVNLSGLGDNVCQITLSSSVAVPQFSIFPAVLTGAGYDYVDGYDPLVLPGGSTRDPATPQALTTSSQTLTFTLPSHNWQNTAMPMDKMIGWAITVRNASAANMAATLTITSIKFGKSVVTGTTSANVVNDQVTLFPNPAKGSFNVDVTAMNVESASVKVMNANGIVVKEFTASDVTTVSTDGLSKGIYLVQVTSGNKVANKKVVVE